MPSLFSADLFPTKWSFLIFISYMGLFINQGILVTLTKNEQNHYNYDTVSAVLLTDCLKLMAAACLYLKDHSCHTLYEEAFKHKLEISKREILNAWQMLQFLDTLLPTVFGLYLVPAALYCVYNNLQFVNLAAYDPTTYYLLLQIRVVVTGIIFQILFKKKLSFIQWMSVIFLTIGCIIKEFHYGSMPSSKPGNMINPYLSFNFILILLQVVSSCFAGVYNEYLLKDKGCDVNLMLQNIFMYIQSILCSFAYLGIRGQLLKAFTKTSILSILQFKVILIMLNNAAIGIVVSLFLHSLNSILKTFASALELMLTAVLCWIIFGIAIDMYTVIAIFIVTSATILYAQNPVINRPKNEIEFSLEKTENVREEVS